MRILTAVFTSDKNKDFFETCYSHYVISKSKMVSIASETILDLYVINFSIEEIEKFNLAKVNRMAYYHSPNTMYVYRPNSGFCDNFNLAREMTIKGNYDYLVYMNDDAAIHEDFILNGINFLKENKDVGFAGGLSQKGGWLEDLKKLKILSPKNLIVELVNIRRLHWEFSACIIPVETLEKTGEMDSMFSPKLGLLSDNDYLLRIRRLGLRTVRNHNMTFWHGKGWSQYELRNPIGHDPHRERAVKFFKLKWGNELSDINGPVITRTVFDKPFNGKLLAIQDEKIVITKDGEFNLEED